MRNIYCCAFAIALTALQAASASERANNPYLDISRNNPFRLVAPSILRPTVEPEPPKLKIRLAGISTVGGRTCALLEVQQIQLGTVTRPVLHEREQFADMKLMDVDAKKGTALVRIGAKTEKLSLSPEFQKDSAARVQSLEPVKYRK